MLAGTFPTLPDSEISCQEGKRPGFHVPFPTGKKPSESLAVGAVGRIKKAAKSSLANILRKLSRSELSRECWTYPCRENLWLLTQDLWNNHSVMRTENFASIFPVSFLFSSFEDSTFVVKNRIWGMLAVRRTWEVWVPDHNSLYFLYISGENSEPQNMMMWQRSYNWRENPACAVLYFLLLYNPWGSQQVPLPIAEIKPWIWYCFFFP